MVNENYFRTVLFSGQGLGIRYRVKDPGYEVGCNNDFLALLAPKQGLKARYTPRLLVIVFLSLTYSLEKISF